jgi:sialic acid synthase SpsE
MPNNAKLKPESSSELQAWTPDQCSEEPCRPMIVAEIGTAHNGDLSRARDLLSAAVEAGADCAKFQMVYADEIVHPLSGAIELPGGKVEIYQRFKALEQKPRFFEELKEACEERGMTFLCSPFGLKSSRILRNMNVQWVKIASPELNHLPLLRETAELFQILSTGVSTLTDIETALGICGKKSALLHCVTSYPAPPEEYNLSIIPLLEALFAVPVGVSDHSKDPLLIPVIATLAGAKIVEKHITLSNEGTGLDDPVALEPDAFLRMCRSVKDAAGKELTYAEDLFGKERLTAILGTGEKTLAPSEKKFYRTTKRSIMAIDTIHPGEILTEKNIALLRSETNLSPGIAGSFWDLVLGKKSKRHLTSGDGLKWRDLLHL